MLVVRKRASGSFLTLFSVVNIDCRICVCRSKKNAANRSIFYYLNNLEQIYKCWSVRYLLIYQRISCDLSVMPELPIAKGLQSKLDTCCIVKDVGTKPQI